MSAKIIDGTAIAARIREDLNRDAQSFELKTGRKIGLAVIQVGENAASKIYVRNKIKACVECSIRSFSYDLPHETPENELLNLIEKLNVDENVDGILIQLPLPKHISPLKALSKIVSKKDADGVLAKNMGNLMLGNPCLKACTPAGIIELIKSTGESIEGKNAVVIGRSNIVGKPVSLLLLQNNATVSMCHSHTKNLGSFTRNADILVAAAGQKHLITGDMIKSGSIVIDVGMNRLEEGIFGDVHFDSAREVAGYITPVPGGVGPMTITMLIKNVVQAANTFSLPKHNI